ncbi:MAG: alpha/beta fold hydrolase [Acidobacteria bacterium]|nr:alpha/beta fold hydrolase [Acidobacteriota bacterium]
MWWLALALLAIPLAGVVYQWLEERRDGKRFPPPGRIADGLHLLEAGSGAPAVVLEAGIAASSLSWRLVQEPLSRDTAVMAYDRAGFGWSAGGATARTMANLVEELRRALDASRSPGPFVLAGHSFGGLLLRHFAAAHPQYVKALVLIDPLEPIEWYPLNDEQRWRLGKGVMLSRRGALLARLGVVRLGLDLLLSGSKALPKLLAKVSSGKGSVVPDRLVGEIRKLPPEIWPAVRAHWCLPRSFRTLAEYLERLPAHCALPIEETGLREIPLVVISASRSPQAVVEAHRRTAALSAHGKHVVAGESGHWVQLDRPDVIVREIRDLLQPGPVH